MCWIYLFIITLSHELKVNIFWVGAANHDKELCDAEGHVSKTAMDNGVYGRKFKFHSGEEHVITAAKFCNEYLNGSNRKRKRKYQAILDDDVPHTKCS